MKSIIVLCCASILLFSFREAKPPKPGKIEINFNGDNQEIKRGVAQAKKIFEDKNTRELFLLQIRKKQDFDYTAEPPKEVADSLDVANLVLRVRGYDGGKDTKTLAYVSSEFPNSIFINTAKTNRPANAIANTIVHELIHNLDRKLTTMRFGHGSNKAAGKHDSAPYWIGGLAEAILSGNVSAANNKTFAPNSDTDLVPIEELEVLDDDKVSF